jgi:hypothetical protein
MRPQSPARRTTPALLASVLAVTALAAILAYYVDRLFLPQPIYAGDVGAYLINALYSRADAARDPLTPEVADSVFLMGLRALHAISVHDLLWARVASLCAYCGGLIAFHRATTRGLAVRERWAFLLLALAFPYYRFVVAVLPEGAYVAALAAISVATVALYASRPLLHAVAAGALTAVLALIKPHGVTVLAALGGLIALDAVLTRRPAQGALRLVVLGAAFLAVGNAIQLGAGQTIRGPLTFFTGDYYDQALSLSPPPGAAMLGVLAAVSMVSALALFAGPPCTVALAEIAGRWRTERRGLRLRGEDAAVLLLMLAALATVAMVSLYAEKVARDPGETRRLWGRYFEFFAPLLWLAAAPHLVRWARSAGARSRIACAGVMLAGLAGLLLSFRAGIVLFPWDATALTAFFQPDPVRAILGVRLPYRGLAVAASLAAALAIARRAPPWRVAAVYFLALGLLSTWLDHVWVGPVAQKRREFSADVQVAARLMPGGPERNAALVVDNNDAHLSFLGLNGRVQIIYVQAGAPLPPSALAFDNVMVLSPAVPPVGWPCRYRGKQLAVCVRPGGS